MSDTFLGRPNYKIAEFMALHNTYVMNGLKHWYDGIWNAGIFMHDKGAAWWKDLASGDDAEIRGTVEDDCISNASDRNDFAHLGYGMRYGTIEIVFKKTNSTVGIYGHSYGSDSYKQYCGDIYYANGCFCQGNRPEPNLMIPNASAYLNKRVHLAFTKDVETGITLAGYVNGISKAEGKYNDYWDISYGNIGGNSSYVRGRGMTGEVCAFRLYDRALTAEEIFNNYATDRKRFNLE